MLYYQHRRLGHALARNTDCFGWIRINRHGFREKDFSVEKPADTNRIVVIGASTTFDTQVSSDERTWPARLEYWLNQAGLRYPVEVINAGVPLYQLIDHFIRLQTDLYRFRPDLIILYAAHNDVSCALRHEQTPPRERANRPNAIPVVTPWNHWLQARSFRRSGLVERPQPHNNPHSTQRFSPTDCIRNAQPGAGMFSSHAPSTHSRRPVS